MIENDRKYKIAFYAPTTISFSMDSIDKRPLAGLETNVMLLASELAKRGHKVTIILPRIESKNDDANNVKDENLKFISLSNIDVLYKEENFVDVLVVVKDVKSILINIPCKARLFLTTDGFNEISTFGIGDGRYANRVHGLLGGSRWHITSLCESSNFPIKRAVAFGNAINLSYFEGVEKRSRKRLIFTAPPFKGLELTIPLIKALREKDPQIEFHSFSSFNIYDDDKPFSSAVTDEYKKVIDELEKIPGVFIHGNILQKDLAREYMKSAILFYPCTWLETSARTILEAEAAGCPIVTSSLGSLPELVGNAGFIIDEQVGSSAYMEKFLAATNELLTNDELWSKMSLNGKMRAKNAFSCEKLEERFEKILERLNLPVTK